MLYRTLIITVNAAWPTANGAVPGAYDAISTAMGKTTQSTDVCVPIPRISTAPMKNPTVVPTSALSAVAPVEAAFVRNTDKAPSTTQNPCCTLVRSATPTATARATAPRALFTNQTERRLAWPVTRRRAALREAVLNGPGRLHRRDRRARSLAPTGQFGSDDRRVDPTASDQCVDRDAAGRRGHDLSMERHVDFIRARAVAVERRDPGGTRQPQLLESAQGQLHLGPG